MDSAVRGSAAEKCLGSAAEGLLFAQCVAKVVQQNLVSEEQWGSAAECRRCSAAECLLSAQLLLAECCRWFLSVSSFQSCKDHHLEQNLDFH